MMSEASRKPAGSQNNDGQSGARKQAKQVSKGNELSLRQRSKKEKKRRAVQLANKGPDAVLRRRVRR